MRRAKQRYDVLMTWGGATRRSKLTVHAARWLHGRREHSLTACGRAVGEFGLVDAYPVHRWHLQPGNPWPWCERCRSAIIAASDEGALALGVPYSNTGVNSRWMGEK